ncbi:MAG: hypothetical protein GY715_20360 [Planctomycetes bacterium]|nr:hypothetical protein [Planctomycetota bacterium]
MNRPTRCCGGAIVVAIALPWLCTTTGTAQDTCSWDAQGAVPRHGSFTDPLNWDLNLVPDSDDDAVFDIGGEPPYDVTVSETALVTTLTIKALAGEPHLHQITGPFMTPVHTNLLQVKDAHLYLHHMTLEMSAAIDVGGVSSHGYLTMTDDSDVTSNVGFIALDDEVGTVVVDEEASWTVTYDLSVGAGGIGNLHVDTGAHVIAESSYIGASDGSVGTGTIDGTGSRWTSEFSAVVGLSGQGSLFVHGGEFTSPEGFIGWWSTGSGNATVDGNGTWTLLDSLYVGGRRTMPGGTATLTIDDDGTVAAADTVKLWGPGSISANGGLLSADIIDIDENPGGFTTALPSTVRANLLTGFDSPHFLGHLQVGHAGGPTPGAYQASDEVTSLTVDRTLTIGYDAAGTLGISGDAEPPSIVSSYRGYIGEEATGSGQVSVSGPFATWTMDLDLAAGLYGQGTLGVHDGGTVSNRQGFIATHANSSGAVTVDNGGQWMNDEHVHVGRLGTGTLDIAGGTVTCHDAYVGWGSTGHGEVTIDGGTWQDTGWLCIGGSKTVSGGYGQLVLNDGNLNVGETLLIWDDNQVIMNGGTTTADVIDIGVGTFGAAWLLVEGGTLTSTTLRAGDQFDSYGVLSLSDGATWSNAQSADFGHQGTSNLFMSGGATATTSETTFAAEGVGGATIQDPGTFLSCNGDVTVAHLGSGYVSIKGGAGAHVVGSDMHIAFPDGNGIVSVCGEDSSLIVDGSIWAGRDETGATGGTAMLEMDSDAHVTADTIHIGIFGTVVTPCTFGPSPAPAGDEEPTGRLTANVIENEGAFMLGAGIVDVGTFIGPIYFTGGTLTAGTYEGDLVNIGGTISPGDPLGVMDVNGDFTQTSGSLALEIGGYNTGTWDGLIISGHATLGGQLEVSLANGFVPDPGHGHIILMFDSHEGVFDNAAERVCTPDGGQFDVISTENWLAIIHFRWCAADLDCSGDVGFGDILDVIGAWGPCAGVCREDLNDNGAVDFADILVIIGAWGACPS